MRIFSKLLLSALMAVAMSPAVFAQFTQSENGTVYLQPLFNYPEAPAYLDDITAKCDYLMDNFWKEMNFKQNVVNQAALQHAFDVYASPMQWASKAKVISSVNSLLKNLKNNPGLATQFMKAAEETFHSPRSNVYIDEVYRMFLDGYINNKKVSKDRKTKYINQLAAIDKSAPDMTAPSIALTDSVGAPSSLRRGNVFTILVFGSPRQDELRQTLLRTGSQLAVERLCQNGGLAINFVCLDIPNEDNKQYLSTLPNIINSGYAVKNDLLFDIRLNPSVYLLDSHDNIMLRDVTMADAITVMGKIIDAATNSPNQENK